MEPPEYVEGSTDGDKMEMGDEFELVDQETEVHDARYYPTTSSFHDNPAIRQVEPSNQRFGVLSEEAENESCGGLTCCECFLMFLSSLLLIISLPFSICCIIKVTKEYERAVALRFGRLVAGGLKGPGLFAINPITDRLVVVDTRTKTFDVPPQEILTRDAVTVTVDAVVYYHIQDPLLSCLNVINCHHATQLLAQTSLRNILGTRTLAEALSEREAISEEMQQMIDGPSDDWGIKVERVEMKDVRLPKQLQRAMAAEAEANREARAKIVAAEGERNASRALKEASDTLREAPSAIQLRYLQTLTGISESRNSTVIVPLPIEVLKAFSKK